MGLAAAPLPGLDGPAVLRAWERGQGVPPVARGAAVLAAALPALPVPAEQLPIGARDTLLLALRVHAFGPGLAAVADCPACGEPADVDVDAAAILAGLPAPELGPVSLERLVVGEREVAFRLPDTRDLTAVADRGGQARELLVRRCVSGLDAGPLPAELVAAVADRIAQADPAADLTIRLGCPSCGHGWSAPLDLAGYVWGEVAAAAAGLLREVHELASRYGWAERDILAMTPARRRAYLELP